MRETSGECSAYPEQHQRRAGRSLRPTRRTLREVHLRQHGSNLKIPWVFRVYFIAGPASENGQAYLDVKLHPDIEEHTLQLKKNFFQVPLWVLARCTSEYSIQMCNLLMADSHSGKKPFTIDLPVLHKILNCHEKSYTRNFSDFRRRILLPPKKN